MQINKGPRKDMMETLKDKINDSFISGEGIVEFFDSKDTAICDLKFQEMDVESTASGDVILKFQSTDDSYILKGTSYGDGIVSAFKIKGTDADLGADEYIIVGTVGSLVSSADLRFNITSWQVGTYVTIEDFSIVFPSGA